jgi:uncharacterized protein (DUF1501 family)
VSVVPSRRVFLKSSGLALVSFGVLPRFLARTALAAGGGARRKTIVVLFQRGACDGLNTVVPYGESAYRSLRPSIAIPPPSGGHEAAVDLDGFFGLHPALGPLLPAWREGSLGIVHAAGSPDGTRSHFDAQDFMESGTPGFGMPFRSLQDAEHLIAMSGGHRQIIVGQLAPFSADITCKLLPFTLNTIPRTELTLARS